MKTRQNYVLRKHLNKLLLFENLTNKKNVDYRKKLITLLQNKLFPDMLKQIENKLFLDQTCTVENLIAAIIRVNNNIQIYLKKAKFIYNKMKTKPKISLTKNTFEDIKNSLTNEEISIKNNYNILLQQYNLLFNHYKLLDACSMNELNRLYQYIDEYIIPQKVLSLNEQHFMEAYKIYNSKIYTKKPDNLIIYPSAYKNPIGVVQTLLDIDMSNAEKKKYINNLLTLILYAYDNISDPLYKKTLLFLPIKSDFSSLYSGTDPSILTALFWLPSIE